MMFSFPKTLKKLRLSSPASPFCYTQIAAYVEVKMKWKKDSFYDSIEAINKSPELKALLSLKNCIINEPNHCIPISAVSKRGDELDVPIKVAQFLRKYPSVFEEFTGEKYNLPWFRLTPEAVVLDKEERAVYENRAVDFVDRLKKFILMSKEKKLPLKIIQGMHWYLGLPDDFMKDLAKNFHGTFEIIEMEDRLPGLRIVDRNEPIISVIQKSTGRAEGYLEGSSNISFPLFPSKGLRLKQKISDWLEGFQKLPYVSPYEDSSHLNPSSDISEKRVVGVLHELLSLFVDHSAERKKLFCLRKYLALPQKFYKAFERHPHMFYLSLMNKTCTVILKEGYSEDPTIEKHPILEVRKRYIKLMNKSAIILKERRSKKSLVSTCNVDTTKQEFSG